MTTFCALLAGALLNALWKGALLSVGVAVLLRLLPGTTAALRSVVWSAVFILLLWLHFAPGVATSGTHHAQAGWSLAIAAAWLAASSYRAVQFVLSLGRLQTLCSRSVPIGTGAAFGLGGKALLCTSTEVYRPAVAGFFRPRILVPEALYDTLTSAELNYILLHETTHLRRGDNWTNLLQKFALIFFPLNPALLWTERRLCREREFACDEQVVAATHSPRAYATCLTSLAERGLFARASSLTLGAWQRRSELMDRVQYMLASPARKSSPLQTIVLGSMFCVGLLASARVLSQRPQLFSFATVQGGPMVAADLPQVVGGRMVLTQASAQTPHFINATYRPNAMTQRTQPVGLSYGFGHVQGSQAIHHSSKRPSSRTKFRQRVKNHSSAPTFRMFVPVTAIAVAERDGWILITL